MLRRCTFALLTVLLVVSSATRLWAQDPARPEGAPAHVSLVEGTATLEREGRIDDAPQNMPLLSGDRIRTRGGRVEILFADGSTLHLDQNSAIDLQSDELVRLIEGRVRLSIPGPAREIAYRIDSPFAWAQIADAGEYRVSLLQNSGQAELEIAVIRGRAELINEDGRTALLAGERAFARANAAPSYAYVFNSASFDAFDRWSEERRSERLGLSTQYLPEEVRSYSSSFDRYGSWRYESSYGYVWYPRVEVGWRPYYRGRWVTLRPYGVTWVSVDPWGWPTHHYGRWGFSGSTWFWIPGRTWGPAWVSWAYAPGYVSWCPLGWNNRPVVQFVNVNVYRGYDPWRAWTVVSDRHFGHDYVHRRGIGGYSIDERTRRAFSERDRAPEIIGYAAPRGSAAPIRVAGRRDSVPGGSAARSGAARPGATPLLTNREDRTGTYRRRDPRIDAPSSPAHPPGEGVTRERAMPDRPMVRSERPTASAAVPGREHESPIYQRPDGYRREDNYRARPETYAPSGRAADRDQYGRQPTYGPPPSYGRAPAESRPEPSARPAPSERRSDPPSRGIERQSPAPSRPSGPDRASPPPSRGGGSGESRSRGEQPSSGRAGARPGGRGGR
jgi:hypothetical protein